MVGIEKPREIAFRALHQSLARGIFIEQALESELETAAPSGPDRRLAQELAYGVVRWQQTLDWLIARKTSGRSQKTTLQILLRLGLYQIFWLDRIPDHAAVNETVALCRHLGFGPQSGFINAVLRGFIREKDPTIQALTDLKTDQPPLGHSHPQWLFDRWQKNWGTRETIALMEWNNAPAPIYARVNTLRSEPGKLLEQWRQIESVDYDFFQRDWTGENLVFELKSTPSIAHLASFRNGEFYLQDPSTLLALHELAPRPDENILDLCAAPGGKATFIAQLMANQGRLVAEDTDEHRLQLLRENCARLGVTCAIVQPFSRDHELFDRILVDAPCSNTGVMRRRIDLRWRIQPAEISRLEKLQLELLEKALPRLKPSGLLVYSTCSLEPEENNGVIRKFLLNHPELDLVRERQLLPFRDGVDGAYVARLQRKFTSP